MHRFSGFVALGDSFTEGLDDVGPDGTYRGWADLVAARLAAASATFRYANLAVRGRLLSAIIDDQLPPALQMGADLVSLSAGVNDAMRGRFDPDHAGELLHTAAARVAASGATLILFTSASDLARKLPAGRLLERRLRALNEMVRPVAAEHRAVLIEYEDEGSLADPRLWSRDRLHLSSLGHQRVAGKVLAALDVSSDPDWVTPLPPVPPQRWWAGRQADVLWARQHLGPWIHRRITGRSSGDGVLPKRPHFEPLE